MKLNFPHFLAFIWACLIAFLLFLGMTSCSASYHYAKAIKKGVRCETITDTLTLTKIDSIFINNEWVKYVTKYDTIVRYNEVFVPKTRYQIKTEYKIKLDSIEVVKYKVKTEYKTKIKTETKNNKTLNLLLIVFGLIALVILAFKFSK